MSKFFLPDLLLVAFCSIPSATAAWPDLFSIFISVGHMDDAELLGEKWPVQGEYSKVRFWYRCFGTHLLFEQWILLEGYADLLQWFSDVPLWHFQHASMILQYYMHSDITVDHQIIEVSDWTSLNYSGTRLRPGYLGELLYWFSILLFSFEG